MWRDSGDLVDPTRLSASADTRLDRPGAAGGGAAATKSRHETAGSGRRGVLNQPSESFIVSFALCLARRRAFRWPAGLESRQRCALCCSAVSLESSISYKTPSTQSHRTRKMLGRFARSSLTSAFAAVRAPAAATASAFGPQVRAPVWASSRQRWFVATVSKPCHPQNISWTQSGVRV